MNLQYSLRIRIQFTIDPIEMTMYRLNNSPTYSESVRAIIRAREQQAMPAPPAPPVTPAPPVVPPLKTFTTPIKLDPELREKLSKETEKNMESWDTSSERKSCSLFKRKTPKKLIIKKRPQTSSPAPPQ